jgi:hypothetical protein
MPVVVTAINFLVGPLIITITDPCLCRSIINRSRRCSGFDIDCFLLLCPIIIVGVIEDDYLAVTRWPEDVAVEIAKKLSGEFLITRSINNGLPPAEEERSRLVPLLSFIGG